MFFNQPTVSRELGSLLREARKARGWSPEQAAEASRLSVLEIHSLEEDVLLDPRIARLHAVTYVRALGINLEEIRDYLPPAPLLIPIGQKFLSNITAPSKRSWRPSLEILAPMGKAVLYLVVIISLLGTWGMIRQLSRVRSMPWTVAFNRLTLP